MSMCVADVFLSYLISGHPDAAGTRLYVPHPDAAGRELRDRRGRVAEYRGRGTDTSRGQYPVTLLSR